MTTARAPSTARKRAHEISTRGAKHEQRHDREQSGERAISDHVVAAVVGRGPTMNVNTASAMPNEPIETV